MTQSWNIPVWYAIITFCIKVIFTLFYSSWRNWGNDFQSNLFILKNTVHWQEFCTLLITEWSAPSAIGIAGLGGGFEVGAEVTDLITG